MAGNSTVLATGTATVSTTGYQTGLILNRLNALIATNNSKAGTSTYDPATGSATIASSSALGLYVVPDGLTATISIQSSSAGVILGAGTNVTLAGGDGNTAIASQGILNYSGAAGLIDAFGDNSSINATSADASIGVGGNNMTVTLGGSNQSLYLDSGTTGVFTESGFGDVIQIGGGVGGGSAALQPAGGASSVATLQLTSTNAVTLGSSSISSVLVLHGGANTISAMASGISSIFAQAGGDVYFGNAASVYFVGATTVVAVSTVFGGSSNDAVFAGTGVDYTEGVGNNVFTSGLAPDNKLRALHSTVTASTGHDTLFGSKAGDLFNLNQGSELFVGGGGADTMFGGSVQPTIFGAAGENLKLIGTHGALAVAFGDKDTIDGGFANQGSTFYAVNYREVGNTTLIGSLAAPTGGAADIFVVGSVAGGGGTVHTITIDNFQTGDAFFLSGYSAADGATFHNAVLANSTQGGGLQFTLSDNTTVKFTNTHPTATFDGGTTAL